MMVIVKGLELVLFSRYFSFVIYYVYGHPYLQGTTDSVIIILIATDGQFLCLQECSFVLHSCCVLS